MTFWLPPSSSDTDEDIPAEWDADMFTPEARLYMLPYDAKPTQCPVCLGKGWVLEVVESGYTQREQP